MTIIDHEDLARRQRRQNARDWILSIMFYSGMAWLMLSDWEMTVDVFTGPNAPRRFGLGLLMIFVPWFLRRIVLRR